MNVEVPERPLSKPSSEDYVSARLLESLMEARLSPEFLNCGLVRNAADKAFQTWRALLAALLRLELDRLIQVVKTNDERRWLINGAVPRVPTGRVKALSRLLEEVGYSGIYFATSTALELHDYQYNGSGPDPALLRFRDGVEAAVAVVRLIGELMGRVEALKPRVKWCNELENAFKALKEYLLTRR